MVTISTPEELLRVLRENPEWKEAVRREILTEELINLPARFSTFAASTEQFQLDTRQAIEELRYSTKTSASTTTELTNP